MSHSKEFQAFRRKWRRAVDAGLNASSYVYYNEVKLRLAKGYTTGHFVTGNVLNSVTRSKPATEQGTRVIKVGTNVKYAAYWEFGFRMRLDLTRYSRATKQVTTLQGPARFMRVEHWREAREAVQDDMRTAFTASFERVLKGEQ